MRQLAGNAHHFQREREKPPRFALRGTFEQDFGQRWKEIYQLEKLKREQLETEFRQQRERLESEMDMAYQDYQTHMMREGGLQLWALCLASSLSCNVFVRTRGYFTPIVSGAPL